MKMSKQQIILLYGGRSAEIKVSVLSVPVTAMKVLRREERVWAAGY